MSNEKDKKLGEEDEKTDFVDKMIAAREKAKLYKQTEKILDGGEEKGEPLQASIVTSAMNQQKVIMDELHKQIAEANKELIEARKEREQAQTQLYNERISILQAEKQKLDETAQQAKGAGAPASELDAYKKVRGALKDEIDELKKSAPPSSGPPSGVSEETQIRLRQMELDQQQVLFQLQSGLEQQKREWDLKMREFDEETRRRWAEYRDSRDFREKGIEGFSDLITSVGASITKERTGGGEGLHHEASISEFPCQVCKTPIPVEPGATKIKCPNEECGAEYDVKERTG